MVKSQNITIKLLFFFTILCVIFLVINLYNKKINEDNIVGEVSGRILKIKKASHGQIFQIEDDCIFTEAFHGIVDIYVNDSIVKKFNKGSIELFRFQKINKSYLYIGDYEFDTFAYSNDK